MRRAQSSTKADDDSLHQIDVLYERPNRLHYWIVCEITTNVMVDDFLWQQMRPLGRHATTD